jgi:hypothetical protein
VVLLSLTAGLFDSVPLAKMKEAEMAVRQTTEGFPEELSRRFGSNVNLTDADRDMILQAASKTMESFTEKS